MPLRKIGKIGKSLYQNFCAKQTTSAVIFHSNQEILRIDVKIHQKSSARVAFKSFLKVITQTHKQTRDDGGGEKD